MKLVRRWLPPVQVSRCALCDETLRERRRRPCPACGSMNRLVVRAMMLPAHVKDRMR